MIDAPLSAGATLLGPEMAARLARLSLLARRLPEARRRGRRRTRRVGSGTDAIDKRGYVPGDDVRRIDWSAYARFERLLVRVVADDAPLRLGLLIDASGSMAFGAPTKLTQAARVAAGLAAVAVGGEDRCALLAPGRGPAIRAPGGPMGLRRILVALEALAPEGPTALGDAARAMRAALGGRGLCVVLSDLWDPAGALHAAQLLRDAGHDVVLARVLTPFEVDPPDDLDGLTVEDAETGELLELAPSGVRGAYLDAYAAHLAELEAGAAELGATLLPVRTDEPFDDVILRALSSGILSRRSVA